MSPSLDFTGCTTLSDIGNDLSFTVSTVHREGDIIVKLSLTQLVLIDAGFEPEENQSLTVYVRDIVWEGNSYSSDFPVVLLRLISDTLDANRSNLCFNFYPHVHYFKNIVTKDNKPIYFPTYFGRYKSYTPPMTRKRSIHY